MGVGVLTGRFGLSRSWVWQRQETIIDWRRTTLRRTETVAGTQWHGQFIRLDITITLNAHSQGLDHWKFVNGKDESPWPGSHNHLAVYPSLALMRNHNIVCLRPLLDIGTDFITKTTPSPLRARRVGNLQILAHTRSSTRPPFSSNPHRSRDR